MAGYADLFGGGQVQPPMPPVMGAPAPAPAPQPQAMPAPQPDPTQSGYSQMQQPLDPVLQSIARPATSPQELENRKVGWQALLEKFQTDPNLQMAMMAVGSKMAQPLQPGQSAGGNAAQALFQGAQVYNAGEYSKYEQARQAQKDSLETKKTTADIGRIEAGTANTIAERPGIASDSRVKVRTEESRIDEAAGQAERVKADTKRIQDEGDLARQRLLTAKNDEEVKAVEREATQRKLAIQKTISDARLRAAAEAEIDDVLDKVKLTRARINEANAGAAAHGATARAAELEANVKKMSLDAYRALPDAERTAVLTKTGKYDPTNGTLAKTAAFWGDLYDKIPATDSEKAGQTREQFVRQKVDKANKLEYASALSKYLAAGGDDQGMIDMLTEGVKSDFKKGNPGDKAVTGRTEPKKPLSSFDKK